MKNWGLRCGQLLAERADIKRMNIVERSAFWFRYDSFSNPYWPYTEDTHPDRHIEREITPQPMRIYLNIDRKSLELQKRIALLETEVNTLKEIKTKKSNRYNKYIS